MINRTQIGTWGQLVNLSKGKLDWEISPTSLLAYLFHQVKKFPNSVSIIVNSGRSQKYGCTKKYALQLKKYWGYMMNNNGKRQGKYS